MKKTLIFLFLITTINVFANFQNDLLKDYEISYADLANDVKLENVNIADFSVLYKPTNNIASSPTIVSEEPIADYMTMQGWYNLDFAADPFDGRIEILVMGEPSASVTATLIISILFGMLLLYKRKQTIEKTYGA